MHTSLRSLGARRHCRGGHPGLSPKKCIRHEIILPQQVCCNNNRTIWRDNSWHERKRAPQRPLNCLPVTPASAVEEAPQLARAARVLELAQRLGFDLADTLAGDRELLADFL